MPTELRKSIYKETENSPEFSRKAVQIKGFKPAENLFNQISYHENPSISQWLNRMGDNYLLEYSKFFYDKLFEVDQYIEKLKMP